MCETKVAYRLLVPRNNLTPRSTNLEETVDQHSDVSFIRSLATPDWRRCVIRQVIVEIVLQGRQKNSKALRREFDHGRASNQFQFARVCFSLEPALKSVTESS